MHRRRDDMGVHHQAPTPGIGPLAQPQTEPQSGVLGGEEGAQVLIESEDQLYLACRGKRERQHIFISSFPFTSFPESWNFILLFIMFGFLICVDLFWCVPRTIVAVLLQGQC